MATRRERELYPMLTKSRKGSKAAKTRPRNTEETLKVLEETAFDEMSRYVEHVFKREGLVRAIDDCESIIRLARAPKKIQRDFGSELHSAAHSYWKQWNRDNPEG